jgi:hypothetical protein
MAPSSSLSLAIRDILDKIGSDDSFFPTETPDFTLPGKSTPESAALEESLRKLVARFQELEQKTVHSQPVVAVGKQLQSVKDDKMKQVVCSSCGHRLNSFGIPLTPEETPPQVGSEKSIALGDCADGVGSNGYESSASESTPTVPVTARNPRADSTVSFPALIGLID